MSEAEPEAEFLFSCELLKPNKLSASKSRGEDARGTCIPILKAEREKRERMVDSQSPAQHGKEHKNRKCFESWLPENRAASRGSSDHTLLSSWYLSECGSLWGCCIPRGLLGTCSALWEWGKSISGIWAVVGKPRQALKCLYSPSLLVLKILL